MKVILGADPLLSPLTGIGHYTRFLALGLLQEPAIEELKLFAYGKFFSHELLASNSGSVPTYTRQKATLANKIRSRLAGFKPAIIAYETLLPKLEQWRLSGSKDFLFHAPNFFIPSFAGPKAVTFHDLSTALYPQYHPKHRVEFTNRQMDISVASDAHIICDTRFIAKEVIAYFGLPEERVSTVHLAASEDYKPRTELECAPLLSQFDIQYNQFFLFVSTIEPRKNLLRLLDAYEKYASSTGNPLPLVIVGSTGWNSEQEHARIDALQRQGLVRYSGYLAQHAVHALYSAARALLYPSIYEGFGLPVLEAMQSGTAVLTSINSPMQEVAQQAAYYVNPLDNDEIVDALIQLAEDDALLNSMVTKGLKRAADFSWQHCASETARVYKKCLQSFIPR